MTKKKPFTKPIRSGMVVSINTVSVRGHKTKIKINKKGEIVGATITHAPATDGRQNIPLMENPQENHNEQAYVVKKTTRAKARDAGKIHKDVKVVNPVDKSIMRHITKKKK